MNKIIKLKGELYDLSRPKVMGILNVTPDSVITSYSIHYTKLYDVRSAPHAKNKSIQHLRGNSSKLGTWISKAIYQP